MHVSTAWTLQTPQTFHVWAKSPTHGVRTHTLKILRVHFLQKCHMWCFKHSEWSISQQVNNLETEHCRHI